MNRVLMLCAALLAAGSATAAETPAPAEAPGGPAAVVDAFHEAMRARNQQAMLDALAADVLVFEQGYLERSRAEYAGSHLHDDMEFASQTERRIVAREVLEYGDGASVLTLSMTDGKFGDKELSLQNTETMVLARSGGRWTITHIHWSAHPRPAAPPK